MLATGQVLDEDSSGRLSSKELSEALKKLVAPLAVLAPSTPRLWRDCHPSPQGMLWPQLRADCLSGSNRVK
jgi:hypothetical protein